jgi:hypothetical protein
MSEQMNDQQGIKEFEVTYKDGETIKVDKGVAVIAYEDQINMEFLNMEKDDVVNYMAICMNLMMKLDISEEVTKKCIQMS